MIKITLLTTLLIAASSQVLAQETDYNKWSAELRFGVNHAVAPVAHSYDSPFLGIGHLGLNGRFMFNNRAGIRLGVGYNHFGPTTKSLDFSTNYFRVSAEGVMNLGNTLHFQDWTERIGLLFHAGIGYSSMKEKSSTMPWDEMVHALAGFTPQVKLNERLSLSLDISLIGHVYQSRTFDYSRATINPNIDGFLYEFTAGLQYNFGSKEKHADWARDNSGSGELKETQDRIAQLEEKLKEQAKDDDKDGVLNHLDLEPNTAPDAVVNTKGQTQVPDESVIKDTDGDGVADFADNCPEIKGVFENRGCPEMKKEVRETIEKSGSVIQFKTREFDLLPESYTGLNEMARVMKENPNYKLVIHGHTDNIAGKISNQQLSEERAKVVRNYLIEKGVSPDRITAVGHGDSEPLVSNDTFEGRSTNRRVVFEVKY